MRDPQTEAAVAALWAAIDARADELTALVGALVRCPSPLGRERAAQELVAQHLTASAMNVDVWDLEDTVKSLPDAGESGVPFPGRPNVAGVQAGTGGGHSLILNGHIDVVSPEPLAAWTHDPWGGEIVGTRMYGRGAFDMKSGVAINCFLPRLLADLGIGLRGDLIVHSVIEEECTGNGAIAASHRHHADAALITEPELNRFTWAHLGVIWFRVHITGKSWHAMETHKGVNAITKAVPIIQALERLHDDTQCHGASCLRPGPAPREPQHRRDSGRGLAEHGAGGVRVALPREPVPRSDGGGDADADRRNRAGGVRR